MANQYTKLFIDNKVIELYEGKDLPLNVSKQVNDLDGNVTGDYSRVSIVIPANKNNKAILGKSRKFFDFRIEIDGQPDLSGKAQVRRIPHKSYSYGDLECQYEINLISKNSSWIVDLGNTYLSELTTESVDWNGANVAAGFLSEPDTRNWAFGLIKWKEWEYSKGTGATFHYMPSVTETTPMLYLMPFIRAAYNSIGYTVNSEWMETETASKLVMLTPLPEKMPYEYNKDYLNTTVSLSAPYTFLGTETRLPCNVIDTAALNSPNAYDTITYDYTAPLAGYYQVNIEVLFNDTEPVGVWLILAVLYVNGVAVDPKIGFGVTNFGPDPDVYPAGERLRGRQGVVFLEAGDVIAYEVDASNVTIDEAQLTFIGESTRAFGMPIDFKYLVSQYKYLDLFEGLKTQFNLTVETDEDARVVTIEPKDSYVDSVRQDGTSILKEGFYKNEQKDYTAIIDRSKSSGEEFPTVSETYIYSYASDSDPTIEWTEGQNDIKIYEGRYEMGEGAEINQTKQTTVPFFAKTIHVLDLQAADLDSDTAPQFLLIYPQNYVLDPTATEGSYDVTPRIAYHAGQRFGDLEGVDGYIEMNEIQGLQTRVPATFMVNYNDVSGLDPNLGFNSQIINGVRSKGLIETYYLNELVRLDRGYLYNAYVRYNSIDNLNFSFRLKAFADNKAYIVQQIQGYNPLNEQPTYFKFFLEVIPTLTDTLHIQNSELTGVVSLLTTV